MFQELDLISNLIHGGGGQTATSTPSNIVTSAGLCIKSEALHYGNGGSGTLASIASLCNANNHNGIINNKKGMMGHDDNGVDGRNQQFAMAQSGVMNSGGLQQQRGQVVMNGTRLSTSPSSADESSPPSCSSADAISNLLLNQHHHARDNNGGGNNRSNNQQQQNVVNAAGGLLHGIDFSVSQLYGDSLDVHNLFQGMSSHLQNGTIGGHLGQNGNGNGNNLAGPSATSQLNSHLTAAAAAMSSQQGGQNMASSSGNPLGSLHNGSGGSGLLSHVSSMQSPQSVAAAAMAAALHHTPPRQQHSSGNDSGSTSQSVGVIQRQRHRSSTDSMFKCNYCPKKFPSQNSLQSHMEECRMIRVHECPQCGKRFKARGGLQQHNRIHINDRPYHCHYCPKRFTQKSHVDQHERIHTGLKPFSCQYCGRAFRQRSQQMGHEATHTNGTNSNNMVSALSLANQNLSLQHGLDISHQHRPGHRSSLSSDQSSPSMDIGNGAEAAMFLNNMLGGNAIGSAADSLLALKHASERVSEYFHHSSPSAQMNQQQQHQLQLHNLQQEDDSRRLPKSEPGHGGV
ncbi:zinc finger protein [Ditylenchus destructor]|nr:zinc finger protein [Ditylenchus destructor]